MFTETLVPRLAETIAREAGVTTAVLDPLEGLGAERIDAGDDYFTVMSGISQRCARRSGARSVVRPALELDGVSFAYRGGPPALEGVSVAVEQGAFLGIAGPNGGGKTTLLRLALGLERPLDGRVGCSALRPARVDCRGSVLSAARPARLEHARHRPGGRRDRSPRRARVTRAPARGRPRRRAGDRTCRPE